MGVKAKFALSGDDIVALEKAMRGAERRNDLQEYKRTRALLLAGRDGLTRREAADKVGAREWSVYEWQRRFESDGVTGLQTKKAPGPARRLSAEQLQRLAEIVERGPEAAGFDTGVWTSAQVQTIVRREFSQTYSISRISRILREMSFSYQLPKIRLAKADPEAKRKWREETMPALLSQAESGEAVVFFVTNRSSSSRAPRQGRGRGWVKESK